MDKQPHRIFRLDFDLSFSDKEKAPTIQDRISSLNKGILIPLIEKILSEFVQEEVLIKLDRLELDIGDISLSQMEEEMPKKLEDALRQELFRVIKTPGKTQINHTQEPVPYNSLEILKIYLERGSYPWWLSLEKRQAAQTYLKQAMEESPGNLRDLIAKMASHPWVRKRIQYSFDEQSIKQLTDLMYPDHSLFIHEPNPEERKINYPLGAQEGEEPGFNSNISTPLLPDWQNDFLSLSPPEQRTVFRKKLLLLEAGKLPNFSRWGIRFWQALVSHIWSTDKQATLLLVSKLALLGKQADKYLANFPPDIRNQLLRFANPSLSGLLAQTEEELFRLRNKGKLGSLTIEELEKSITLFSLRHLTGSAAVWVDYDSLVKSFLQSLGPNQNQSFAGLMEELATDRQGIPTKQALEIVQESDWLGYEIQLVQNFFTTEQLAPDLSLAQIREFLGNWYRDSPRSLKIWLQARIQDSLFIERISIYLSSSNSIELINLLHYPAGAYARELYQYLSEEIGISPLPDPQNYWKITWLAAAAQKMNFRLPNYILDILEKLAKEARQEVSGWKKKLLDVESSNLSYPQEILRGILTIDNWRNFLVTQEIEISELSTEQQDPFIDMALILSDPSLKQQKSHKWIFSSISNKPQLFSADPKTQSQALIELLQKLAAAESLSFISYLEILENRLQNLRPLFLNNLSYNKFREIFQKYIPRELPALELEASARSIDFMDYSKDSEFQAAPDEVWLIPNAGIILLWPYLGTFFERAGLMENGHFIDEKKRQEAVFLLEYLIRGEHRQEEYHLVLNKLLCGYPLYAPLEVRFQESEEIEVLCEGLLEAVIQHWEVIGDISIQALRQSFLIREGHLTKTQKGWLLQIAEQSYDILLSQLPWGISVVNLSWLEEPIEVKWR